MRRPRPALASTVMTIALLAGCADVPRPVDMTQPYQQSILAGSENLHNRIWSPSALKAVEASSAPPQDRAWALAFIAQSLDRDVGWRFMRSKAPVQECPLAELVQLDPHPARPIRIVDPYNKQQSFNPQSYAERWSVSWCGVQQAWIVFDVMTPAGRDTRAFKTVDRPR